MLKEKSIFISLAVTTMIVLSSYGCDKKKGDGTIPQEYTVLQVQSNINTLKASETSWDKGDQIGLFAMKSGNKLSISSLYNKAHNLPYTTPNGDGHFLPNANSEIRLLPNERIDLISYYPYQQQVGADYKLRINVSDQSDLTKIDLLYSNNARGLNASQPKANLQFKHMMSQLQISAMSTDGTDLSALKVTVGDVATEGVFDLATGGFTSIGTTKAKVTMHTSQSIPKGATFYAILLPSQELKGLTYTFEVGGKSFTYTEKEAKELLPGERARRNFEISAKGVKLIDATIRIIGPKEKKPQDPAQPEPGPTPTPPPEGYGNKAYYMEQVLIQNGYMEDRIIHQEDTPDSYFAGGKTPGGKRRNYTIYFSKNNRQPYMVAYPMYKDCLGEWSRKKWGGDPWAFGPGVDKEYQMDVIKRSFQPSGYDRGHMLASQQRTASKELNRTTFYMTNIVPQERSQNRGIWKTVESLEKTFATNASTSDTLYVVCGPTFAPKAPLANDNNNKKCPIPTHTWKVLLKKNKAGKWISIGVKMPNEDPAGRTWDSFACTVAELEKELGVKFFPFLPENEATAIKSLNNTKDW